MIGNKAEQQQRPITTLIFDVDDTLYDLSTGFTTHRNGAAVQRFMVERLGFASMQAAKNVRDEYFEKYHSTAKALTVAEREGKFPNGKNGERPAHFETKELAQYWADHLDFSLLGGPQTKLRADLQACKLRKVAFSNAPRIYVLKVLQELQLLDVFGEEHVFAVDDTLPHCKPEKEAFDKIFDLVGTTASECVMVEDSMKNLRRSKELGMNTVLVAGKGRLRRRWHRSNGNQDDSSHDANIDTAEATKSGDAAVEEDDAVDCALGTIQELRTAQPGLWSTPATFRSR